MTYSKNRSTAYHQQDTDYYCGAASAQMILDSIGAGLIDQNTLYSSNHSHNTQSGWSTDPDGLNYTLNHYKPSPPTFNSFFIVEPTNNEPDGSKRIVETIQTYNVATATLVYDCGHWVVVRGFTTDVSPTSSTYSILGFYINNPWPPVPSFYNASLAPPPLHSSGDGCGTGGTRGIVNEYVSYTDWGNTYLTGCDVWGVGHKQYVSVCDPRIPRLGRLVPRSVKVRARGHRFMKVGAAKESVLKAIEEHRLRRDEHFSKALSGAMAGQPVLVQRLDRVDTYYYLIPMTRKNGATALLSLDALTGEFNGGQAFIEPVKDVVKRPAEASKEILGRVLRQPIELGEGLGKLIIRDGAYCFYPTMVWRPCQESRSPYYPFYMITVGNTQIYVGYDGRVYSRLHNLGPGG